MPTQENGGISADGLTHTFKLRTDVKFHDGRPLTAKDVVYTYTTMQNRRPARRAPASSPSASSR